MSDEYIPGPSTWVRGHVDTIEQTGDTRSVQNPRVTLQDGTRSWTATAREVTGEERALWWERCVSAYPPYAEYQQRTGRLIPVLVLEPTPER